MRALSWVCCLVLFVAGCGGSSDVTDTGNDSTGESGSGNVLTEAEQRIVCESFVDEHEALLAVPLHLRAPAFSGAADSLGRQSESDAAGRLAIDMAAVAVQIEVFADSVAVAESSLDFEPINYMYTANGLFVDDGNATTLTELDISVEELQAVLESSKAVLVTVESLCRSPGAPSAEDQTTGEAPATTTSAGISAADPQIVVGGYEFAVASAGFDTTVLGLRPTDMDTGDTILYVELELLDGNRASFEVLEPSVIGGDVKSQPVALISDDSIQALANLTQTSSEPGYHPDPNNIAWVYVVSGEAADLRLVFPSGEIVDLTPVIPTEAPPVFHPNANTVVATIEVGEWPEAVAVGAGAVWVANFDDGSVSRIDPSTNSVVSTINVGYWPMGVAVGFDAVWVANNLDDSVSRIDPATNTVVATIEVGDSPDAVATGAGAVWVVSDDAGSVLRIDPATNSVVATINTDGRFGVIAVSDDAVWVANNLDDSVSRIDPATNAVVATVSIVARPTAMAVGGGAVWVAVVNFQNGSVSRIDPSTNSVVSTINVGGWPNGLAVGDGAVWVSDREQATVSRSDVVTNTLVATIQVGSVPGSVVVGEGAVWVANGFDNTVSRIQP